MASPAPARASRWEPLAPEAVAELLAHADARWWLSGGAALDHWLGSPIRERANTDVSTTWGDLDKLLAGLPAPLSAWVASGDDLVAWADLPDGADLQPVLHPRRRAPTPGCCR